MNTEPGHWHFGVINNLLVHEITASGGTRTNCQVHALCTWTSEDLTWAKFCAAEIEPLFPYILIFFSLKKKKFLFLEFMLNFPTTNIVN